MKATTLSFNVSAMHTRTSAYLAIDESCGYVVLDASLIMPVSMDDSFVSAYVENSSKQNTRRSRLERDPAKRAALARARQRIADALSHDSEFSLAKLRLQAGLSQAQLASMMNTQQPAIARLEKGETDPTLSTIHKLSQALGVSTQEIINSFEHTKAATKK
ncbi:helix-turn-helix domain-containing protein [Pollutimonas sp. M17]|uniref:helix-turn-helix domain-containing protein n=1 Tax=Pollutimonas sp. M17 TaxID=2962065 RepID=UPI0021F4C3B2|nr:helix-turn-helix transcriptional regulator [Pollutimonas sp. M17]UYO95007.1 helix-turn-helix domain-containing protein [Pollutimonas sp. M17]